jgi:Zn-dependent protease
MGVILNCLLAVFNLIPIPPLDGSRLALRLGVYSEEIFQTLSRWGFLILLVVINIPGFNFVVWSMISPILEFSAMIWPSLGLGLELMAKG